ncbi:SID1 transmembrane family member 2-like [Homarus americanus]|uniref:SID1 transmembrane family member 2-like n=1 Tax=Homarus americanus TaxID=6706 RepID=A0A8J5KE63_HOMAM|nr:SID1 transmembrane family member 2-like [Homarus americanus]
MYQPWHEVHVICHLLVAVMGSQYTELQAQHNNSQNISATDCPTLSTLGCVTHNKVNIQFNSTSPCLFNCTYDPKLGPIRLELELHYKKPDKYHTFVSVQQKEYLNAWTLPITFPVHGKSQKYSTIEEQLCPPAMEENLQFRIITTNPSNVTFQLQLTNDSYLLQKGYNVTVISTPVSPWYKLYQWGMVESSVLVTADSLEKSDSVCAILALQNAQCPVDTDESGLRSGHGRYQTFTARAGMIARKEEFPDGVHIIVLSLPDNEPCTLNIANKDKIDSRHKTVVLQVYGHATVWSTWYIFAATAAVLAGVVSLATKVAVWMMNRNLTYRYEISDDQRALLDENMQSVNGSIYQVAAGGGIAFTPSTIQGFSNSRYDPEEGTDIFGGHGAGEGTEIFVASGEHDAGEGTEIFSATESFEPAPNTDPPAIASPTTYAPQSAVMNFTPSFNPRFVWWWKQVAVYEAKKPEAKVAEIGFQNNLVIMALFSALPVMELIRFYLGMMMNYGVEDQCYFNSRCLTALGKLPDFTRVFSNIVYIFKIGIGVSRHYGLFTSLGYGLVIEGIMSALYHTCPNSVTIKFDMMFMYVIMVAAVVGIWGLRHGDVTHHVYPTMMFIGMALILADGCVWSFDNKIPHLSNKKTMDMTGQLLSELVTLKFFITFDCISDTPYMMYHVCKGWKPVMKKLEEVVRDEDRTSKPMHIIRISMGTLANFLLIIYGCALDPNVYSYVLIICLTNMGLYVLNYIITKVLYY